MIINGKITIGDFLLRFEKVYGDIREQKNRKVFGSAFHKYYGEKFNWSMYDYAVREINHNVVEWESAKADRELNRKIILHTHEECTGVIALRAIEKEVRKNG